MTTQASRGRTGNLPHDLTSFVGRRHATTELKHALAASRLVTLTGPGGVGKSRLASHVAQQLRRAFADGVWLVELAEVHDPALVTQAVATALGLRDQSARDPTSVLVDFLAGRELLLLLDNCEHVLDASAVLASTLLSAVPGLRILATSREPLGVNAELVWPVPPLSLPAPDASLVSGSARRYGAVALFEDRAAAARPGFTVNEDNQAVVAQLCRRLDGVPLAIELAAVRLRVLSLEEVLARLEDRFQLLTAGSRAALPRHQTLRAAVGWSYDLCSAQERLLWARCSVFAGEFDLDAAENVCSGHGLGRDEVFLGVIGLVEKSVLTRQERAGPVRYRMLETIRQYGTERLAGAGETTDVRRRHRDYYLRLAEQSEAESCGARQVYWSHRLRGERSDLWAALDYCLTTPGEAGVGLRLAAALWFYWAVCGFVRDGRHWLDRALAQNPQPGPERARGLLINGWTAYLQGDPTRSVELLDECCDLARQLGDENVLIYAIQFLGGAEMMRDDLEHGVPKLDQALAHHHASGHWTVAALLVFPQRGTAARLLGDTERALALLTEGRDHCVRLGERWVLSWIQCHLGITLWEAAQTPRALEQLQESLRTKEQLGDQVGIPFCVEVLAWIAVSDGDPRRAATLFGVAEQMWEAIGRPLFGLVTLLKWRERGRARTREALGSRTFEAVCEAGARLPLREAVAYALGERTAQHRTVATAEPGSGLTKREDQVAALVAAGMSNREIAASLVISQRTAESHIERILTKLGFTSRVQIAAWINQRDGSVIGE